jgi:hypothetical protein
VTESGQNRFGEHGPLGVNQLQLLMYTTGNVEYVVCIFCKWVCYCLSYLLYDPLAG